MWKRATWHECADELDSASLMFRRAYWGRGTNTWPRDPDDLAEMERTSKQGVQILRALALAVRSEQDFNMGADTPAIVGAVKNEGAESFEVSKAKQLGGYKGMLEAGGHAPLGLRQALNKIAHADPRNADFYLQAIGPGHDLLLFGENRGKQWFAAISIPELVKAVRDLPDSALVSE